MPFIYLVLLLQIQNIGYGGACEDLTW